jgi:flagellar hook protein FlgE
VAPSALEAANVDLADEFTKMIVTQRAYSANARVVTTTDEMLDELIRISR